MIIYIFGIILFLTIIGGIFSFIKLKKIDSFYIKYIKNNTKIIFILPLFDVLSTIIFTSKHGIESELNPLGKLLMYNFGNISFILMYFFAVFIIFSFLFLSSYISYKNPSYSETNKESFFHSFYLIKGTLIGIYIIIIAYNLMSVL